MLEVARQVFGYTELRAGQRSAIDSKSYFPGSPPAATDHGKVLLKKWLPRHDRTSIERCSRCGK